MLDEVTDSGAAPEHRKWAYVVDDDDGFRGSLVLLLKSNGWAVEGFDSPTAFIDSSGGLEPGLLLLDLHLPGTSGLELLESRLPELDRFAVIMVTGAGEIHTAVRTIKAGALDFIEKPFTPGELLERLDALDSTVGETLRAKSLTLAAKAKIDSLSPRERDVLERLLAGASNKLIGRALDLSPRTVEMHRAKMLQRLGVETTSEALDIARRAEMVPVSPE